MKALLKTDYAKEQERQIAKLNKKLDDLHKKLDKTHSDYEKKKEEVEERLKELKEVLSADKKALIKLAQTRKKKMNDDIKKISLRATATAAEIMIKEQELINLTANYTATVTSLENEIATTADILEALEGEL